MPRTYVRKTDKGQVPKDVMQRAIQVVRGGTAVREVARQFGIARSTLNNNLKKISNNPNASPEPNYRHSMIFSDEQETSLAQYLETCSRMFHGLTTRNVRALAYEMAAVNEIKMPKSWQDNKTAGKEWLLAFMKRHANLSIRQPEATSLSRAIAFNRHNVGVFFDNLEERITSLGATGGQIFNLDETGLTTVQKTPKVVAPKGIKQIGQITSRERGELVTMCAIVSATGQSVPPVYVFPRKNFKDFFLYGAPESSLGLTSSNGWMTSDNFVLVLKHFIRHVRPSQDFPVILIMDNHESHLSYEALQLARASHIHVITLPPHTSNKTQPLDRTIFGPMKTAYNRLANSWMLKNVGKPITIYQIAELGGNAWMTAATQANIIAGFNVSGVWPFNREAFNSDDYLPSDITDRPPPADDRASLISKSPSTSSSQSASSDLPAFTTLPASTTPPITSSSLAPPVLPSPLAVLAYQALPVPVSSTLPASVAPSASSATTSSHESAPTAQNFISPDVFRGLPKAQLRKETTGKGRKKGRSMVATSTPELMRMSKEAEDKATKKARLSNKRRPLPCKKLTFDTETSDSDMDIDIDDETDSDIDLDADCDEDLETCIELNGVESVSSNDFVLCEYGTKRSVVYYVGMVRNEVDEDGDVEVEFFRKSEKVQGKFVRPNVDDIASVPLMNIKAKLTRTSLTGTMSRTKDAFCFKENLSGLNIR